MIITVTVSQVMSHDCESLTSSSQPFEMWSRNLTYFYVQTTSEDELLTQDKWRLRETSPAFLRPICKHNISDTLITVRRKGN